MKPTASFRRPRVREVSARQRACGDSCDKNGERDFSASSSTQRPPLLWPEAFPKEERIPLTTGHRSFAIRRQVVPSDMLRGQVVDIRGHMLLSCERSRLLIERDHLRLLIQPRQSVLLSNTKVTISELPEVPGTYGVFTMLCFGDETLAQVVSMNPRTNDFLFRIRDYPCPDGIIHLPDEFPRSFRPTGVGIAELLHPILSHVFNRPTFPLWKLCLKQIVIPRIRVQIFLENLLLRPRQEHPGILEKYPGGEKVLRREMSRLGMPSIAAMVQQRRMELCHTWRNHGGRSFEEIMTAMCIEQPGQFISRYERWIVNQPLPAFPALNEGSLSDTLLAAHAPFLPSLRGNYWARRTAAECAEENKRKAETDESFRELLEMVARTAVSAPEFARPELRGPAGATVSSIPTGQIDSAFWEMQSTGIGMVVQAEGLSSIPGLEDCADLLMAA